MDTLPFCKLYNFYNVIATKMKGFLMFVTK